MRRSKVRPVVTYAREAVLNAEQLGAALQVSASTVERMDLPFFRAGNRVRYVFGQVIDVLAERAKAMGAPMPSLSFVPRKKGNRKAS
jgi:hypothetical protein